MKNYKNLNEKMRYMVFDWDNNILNMSTILHYKKRVGDKLIDYEMNPQEFAIVRGKYGDAYRDNEEWLADDNTFLEFRDIGPRGEDAFLLDVKEAIKNKDFGPSWEVFLNTLIEGSLFSIITTRGHEPDTIKNVILYIINNILSETDRKKMKKNLKEFNKIFNKKVSDSNLIDNYLNSCYFIGLSSKAFIEQYGYDARKCLDKGKRDGIEYFLSLARKFAKRLKINMQLGFSDDEVSYAESAKELFMHMKKSKDIQEHFYVFDTSNPEIKGGIKTKF